MTRPFVRTIHTALAGLLLAAILPSTTSAQDPALFPRPPELEGAVAFWTKVYAEWSQDEVAFHDRDDLSIVYEVLAQPKSTDPASYRSNEAVQEGIKRRYREILLDLAARDPDPRTLSGAYLRVYELFGPSGGPDRWRQAADRIRVQRGLKERFLEGLVNAGGYREHILAVLDEESVPREIAWLPMVESTFNLEARSAVGAAGVWQFMPGTGRLYMRVDRTVDERLDPIIAARGAARLLKQNLSGLGNWPLALTAYNHGYYGMRRAVREVGTTDYMTIRKYYDGPAFGFASKNFYAEFLAAVHVAENALRYFGPIAPRTTIAFDEVELAETMSLGDVARAVRIEPDDLWDLNPSLTSHVRHGRRSVPSGFVLRVPAGMGVDAPDRLASAAAAQGPRPRDDGPRYVTVQRGDTLSSIAARHGTTVATLLALNDIRDANTIRVGQRIQVRG